MSKAVRAGRPRDEEIDQALLAVARKHLADFGYESMSVAAVAEEAGTTRQALYRRWPSKASLAIAAVASMSRLSERPDTDDPFADLVKELEAFREGVTRRNGVSLVGTMLQSTVEPELRALFRERLVAPRRHRISHILRRAQQLGLLDDDADVEFATAAATGTLYAMSLAGSKINRTWPRRTAALVWRSCGGAIEPSK